jgi:hypothetical protein
MSLLGQGAVAIWHDLAAAGRDQFYAWHGLEHMPERVAIPGFIRGRRYIALDAEREFFNLYETLSADTVAGADYRQRLDNPTPWTISTVTHFQRVARGLCSVRASEGPGQGGLIATWRYALADAASDATAGIHVDRLGEVLAAMRQQHTGIAATHILLTDEQASSVDSAERKARNDPNEIPGWILLVEGWGDQADFIATCEQSLGDETFREHGASGEIVREFYQLQATALAPAVLQGSGL